MRPSADQLGDSSTQYPAGELARSRGSRDRAGTGWPRRRSPSAVRSEAKTSRRPSGLGLGSRSWYRSDVSGLELAAGQRGPDRGRTPRSRTVRSRRCSVRRASSGARAARRARGTGTGRPSVPTLEVPDDERVAIAVARGEEQESRPRGVHAGLERVERLQLGGSAAGHDRARLAAASRAFR